MKNYSPYEKSQIDLMFINRFNNSGVGGVPMIYPTVSKAEANLSATMFWKMFKKLNTAEKDRLINAE